MTTFERVGIGVFTFLGSCLGLMVGLGSDLPLTPLVVLVVPGSAVGWMVGSMGGLAVGVVACSLANGVAYGFMLYGWYRLTALLCRKGSVWGAAAGRFFSRRSP